MPGVGFEATKCGPDMQQAVGPRALATGVSGFISPVDTNAGALMPERLPPVGSPSSVPYSAPCHCC